MRRRVAAALVAPGFALGGYVAAKSTSAWPEMGHAQPGHALLNYQEPHVELVKSRRDQGGSDDALDGAAWDRRQVIMRDGRKERLTLDDIAVRRTLPDPGLPSSLRSVCVCVGRPWTCGPTDDEWH